ncbi:MAG: ABC transporter ATP-binding protein [Elusimicrobia bacterium]|nr:ABC transporter ATP-binding protein [Elusimicrobiota bacterium]
MSLLTVEDLFVEYRHGARRVPAVRHVSFSLKEGECLGVAGESGSGKSTLALALLKLLPDSASLSAQRLDFDGRSVLDLAPRELRALRGGEVGFVFQDPFSALNPVLTVGDQVDEVLEWHRGGRNRQRVLDLFAQVRLPDPGDLYGAYPHQLSGGQRQRVCLAMAIASNPKLLIADEPTTALDVTVQREILNLLDDLRRDVKTQVPHPPLRGTFPQEGKENKEFPSPLGRGQGEGLAQFRRNMKMALILVTHNVGLLSERSDRLAVMYAGEIVEIGPTATVLSRPAHPYTQGLLKSLPRLSGTDRRLPALPGQPPDPKELPSGCPFRVRCPSSFERCVVHSPALRPVLDGTVQAACHLFGDFP